MNELITTTQAEQLIRAHLYTLSPTTCPLEESSGRHLSQDLKSDRPLPPYDRVMMDGIALSHQELEKGTRTFPIAATQAAGSPPHQLEDTRTCIEVMTGCVLPTGCDCVIPIEQIKIKNNLAQLQDSANPAQKNQHIHPTGNDCPQGSIILKKATPLHTPELTIAASCGHTSLPVSTLPKIHLLSTGDELVAPQDTPQTYQIRRSHATALRSCIEGKKLGHLTHQHLADDPQHIRTAITQALPENNVLLLTGGISMGKFDHVAPILQQLLGKPHFHGIAQRPGKPMAFWTHQNTLVFALPGNPVSVMACASRYLLPALTHLQTGHWPIPDQLSASGTFHCPSHFTALIPATLENGKALLSPPDNSGNFLALAHTHGIAELPGEFAGKALLNQLTHFYPWL